MTEDNTTIKNSGDISFSYKNQIFQKFDGYIWSAYKHSNRFIVINY